MQQVCLLTVVSLFVTSAQCKTPGLQTRITDRALEYGTYTWDTTYVECYFIKCNFFKVWRKAWSKTKKKKIPIQLQNVLFLNHMQRPSGYRVGSFVKLDILNTSRRFFKSSTIISVFLQYCSKTILLWIVNIRDWKMGKYVYIWCKRG